MLQRLQRTGGSLMAGAPPHAFACARALKLQHAGCQANFVQNLQTLLLWQASGCVAGPAAVRQVSALASSADDNAELVAPRAARKHARHERGFSQRKPSGHSAPLERKRRPTAQEVAAVQSLAPAAAATPRQVRLPAGEAAQLITSARPTQQTPRNALTAHQSASLALWPADGTTAAPSDGGEWTSASFPTSSLVLAPRNPPGAAVAAAAGTVAVPSTALAAQLAAAQAAPAALLPDGAGVAGGATALRDCPELLDFHTMYEELVRWQASYLSCHVPR